MADNRYGQQWRGRDDSIFSDDDDRWSRGSDRWSRERGGGDDRGFFDRAGDEVRSWFGDEEAERRRERDMRRDEASGRDYASQWEESPDRSRYGRSDEPAYRSNRGGGSGGDYRRAFWGGGSSRSETGSGYRDRPQRSQYDENYLRWREREIARLDQEYEDYCRECDQQFGQDFQSWRNSRLTEGGTSGQFGATGGDRQRSAPTGGAARTGASSESLGAQGAGATTSGGGTASATKASTGSSSGATSPSAEGGTTTTRSRRGRS